EIVSVYLPGFRFTNVNVPALCVVAVRVSLVARSFSSRPAPGITAFCGSSTVTLIRPSVNCAITSGAVTIIKSTAYNNGRTRCGSDRVMETFTGKEISETSTKVAD